MRRPRVIMFCSGVQAKQDRHYLVEKHEIHAFPISYKLKRKDIKKNQTVVIFWYESDNQFIRKKLLEIKKSFSKLPIFMISENPTIEDLILALNLNISGFFHPPLNKEEITHAIDEVLSKRKSFIQQWQNNFKSLPNKLFGKFNKEKFNNLITEASTLGFVPQGYSDLLQSKYEAGKSYDIRVQFFDELVIKSDTKTLNPIKGKKNNSLLAYLLFHHQKPIHRDILMEKFWSNVPHSSSRNSLNVAIHAIRKAFAPLFENQEVILLENDCYAINPQLEILLDTEEFDYFWKKGKAIEATQGLKHALGAYNRALGIYQGDFLSRMIIEDWCEPERDNLKETYLFILNRLSTYFYDENNYDACINIGKKMLAKDICLEEVHRKLIKCYHGLGLNDLAVRQYVKCKENLQNELGIPPSKLTEALFTKIQNGQPIY